MYYCNECNRWLHHNDNLPTVVTAPDGIYEVCEQCAPEESDEE